MGIDKGGSEMRSEENSVVVRTPSVAVSAAEAEFQGPPLGFRNDKSAVFVNDAGPPAPDEEEGNIREDASPTLPGGCLGLASQEALFGGPRFRHSIPSSDFVRRQYLRPAVMLFFDNCMELLNLFERKQEEEYEAWNRRMRIKGKKKVVVLEIGCGIRVPSVRSQAEGLVWDINNEEPTTSLHESEAAGGGPQDTTGYSSRRQAHLIRINPGDETWAFLQKKDNPLCWYFDEEDLCYRTIAGHREEDMRLNAEEDEEKRVGAHKSVTDDEEKRVPVACGHYLLLNDLGAKDALTKLDSLLERRPAAKK
ncbi:unnamed protein product [Amoebophrya sp. A25]|nr:unnamed protein product [Amoebophrya sp. A25]|eukprot:GSA25T00009126001.1